MLSSNKFLAVSLGLALFASLAFELPTWGATRIDLCPSVVEGLATGGGALPIPDSGRPQSAEELIVLGRGQLVPFAPQGKIYVLREVREHDGIQTYVYELISKFWRPGLFFNKTRPEARPGTKWQVASLTHYGNPNIVSLLVPLRALPRAGYEADTAMDAAEEAYLAAEMTALARALVVVMRSQTFAGELPRSVYGSLRLAESLILELEKNPWFRERIVHHLAPGSRYDIRPGFAEIAWGVFVEAHHGTEEALIAKLTAKLRRTIFN